MHIALAVLIFFGIFTLWIPAYWPTAAFQAGIFVLAIITNLLILGQSWSPKTKHIAEHTSSTFPGSPYNLYPVIPLTLATFWGLVQLHLGLTIYRFETEIAVVNWATLVAVFLVAVYLFRKPAVRSWFLSAMLWFGFITAILATIQTFTSGGKIFWLFPSGYNDCVMGPFLNRNLYSTFIEIVLPVALYEALQNERNSLAYSGVSAVMYASVIASASRAGTVLVTAESAIVIILMWVGRRASTRRIISGLLRIVILFSVFVSIVGWRSVWARFWQPDPMSLRAQLNVSSLHMIETHTWSGVGLGTWPTAYPRYAIIDIGAFANQAHNDWLQWTAEGGIFFGLLLSTLFIWSLRPAFRSIWGLGVIAVFLHALVDYPFSRPALASWVVLALALLATDQNRMTRIHIHRNNRHRGRRALLNCKRLLQY